MNLIDQITKLSQELLPEKQVEELDFVEFLASRQAHQIWTIEERQKTVAKTMGCLADSRSSSDAFAGRKVEEKAKEERRWKP